MRDIPVNEVCNYACEDADITFQLKKIIEPQIQKDHLKELFYQLEMPLVPVLQKMEREGIAIDVLALQEYSKKLEIESKELEIEIKAIAGVDFNLDSPKQLGEVLFDTMKIN